MNYLIQTYNSPLTRVFSFVVNRIRESGIEDNLAIRWEGMDLQKDWSVDKMILAPGQVKNASDGNA